MKTVSSQPRRTSLDEQIDEAVELISARDLRRGCDYLDFFRAQARSEKDLGALQRITDIASSARYLSRRYQGRFDRLARTARADMAEVVGGERMPAAPAPSGVGALVGGITLHFVIGLIALVASAFMIALADMILWPTEYPGGYADSGGETLFGLWAVAGALLWTATLGVIVWRWVAFRETSGRLVKTSLAFSASAPFAFVPLLYFVLSERGRRYVGLVRGPR